jgi:hypothetical protein
VGSRRMGRSVRAGEGNKIPSAHPVRIRVSWRTHSFLTDSSQYYGLPLFGTRDLGRIDFKELRRLIRMSREWSTRRAD